MKRLLVLSGKGGTGKTTTAAAFMRFAEVKAAADCDVDAPNLHLVSKHFLSAMHSEPVTDEFFGGEKAVIAADTCVGCGTCAEYCRFKALEPANGKYKVNEFACEGCGVCEYVCPQNAVKLQTDVAGKKELHTGDKVFSTATLKMGRGNSGKLVTEVKMAMLKNAPETELAIVDGSPGIGCPVIASVSGMDVVLIVAEPSMSGLSDLKRLVKTTKSFGTTIAVCVNKWDVSPEYTALIQQFCGEQMIPFVGEVPYDKSASKAINEGKSVADTDCPARDALLSIYQNTLALL